MINPLLLDFIWHVALGPYSCLIQNRFDAQTIIESSLLAVASTIPIWGPVRRQDWRTIALRFAYIVSPTLVMMGMCWFGLRLT